MTPRGKRWDKLKSFSKRATLALAVAYPLALVAVAAALRFVGERWWLTTIALYLPPIGFGLPLPLLATGLVVARAWRWLVSPLIALFILLFPLMGLELSWPRAETPGAFRFKLFAVNVGLGGDDIGKVVSRLHGVDADVMVLSAVAPEHVSTLNRTLPHPSFLHKGEFVIASRFPIEQAFEPPEVVVDGVEHSARYVRCVLHTPAGPIRLYATHPISPHTAFNELRGESLRSGVTSGRVFGVRSTKEMSENTRLRLAQLDALAADARGSSEPVVIAGDTNLPSLSWALSHWLRDYRDAFAEAGLGFGYTYPAHKRPWMRIDRVLAGPRFRFLGVSAPRPPVFKHLPVLAELELLPAPP